MEKIAHWSLSGSRLVPAIAIAALVAALFAPKVAALHSQSPIPQILPIYTACDSANVIPSPFGAQTPGTAITLTAGSTGCDVPEYRYLLLAPGTTTWVFMTPYTTSSTWAWNTTNATLGVWQIGVWARGYGGVASYNAYAIGTMTLVFPFCQGATVSVSPSGQHAVGSPVYIAAGTSGCPEPFIKFWMMSPGSSSWVAVTNYYQDFGGASDTYVWNTTGFAPGQYRFAVWDRQLGSTRRYDSYAMATVYLMPA